MMRYLVRDEDGAPLRKFWTYHEAVMFCRPGFTIEKLPHHCEPGYAVALAAVGDALL